MPNADHVAVTLADLDGRNFAHVWEVAAILEVDPRTIRAAVRDGRIPAVKAGSNYRIPVAWLIRAASGEVAVQGGQPDGGPPRDGGHDRPGVADHRASAPAVARTATEVENDRLVWPGGRP